MEVSIEGKLSTAAAAKKIGVSQQSINNWCIDGKLPHVKAGKSYFVDPDVCDQVKELVKEHKGKWHQYSEFPAAAGKAKKSKKTETEEDVPAEVDEKSNAQKIADLGLKLHAAGQFEEAADAMAILINQCDWSEVAL